MQRDGAQLGKACNSLLSVGRLTPSIMARLLEKSWAFTENDLALGVQMLHHARSKHPWFEMHTRYPFDKTGVRTAVADAMAMRTVNSTIVPFPHLLGLESEPAGPRLQADLEIKLSSRVAK
jgi:hypothetical protein